MQNPPRMNVHTGPGDNRTLDPSTLTTYPYLQQSFYADQPHNMSLMDNPYNGCHQLDVFSRSHLSSLPVFNPDVTMFDSLPTSSHDDLNHFFNDSAFGGGTPVGMLSVGSRFSAERSQGPQTLGQSWLRNVQQSPAHWESEQDPNGLAIVTDGCQVKQQRETVLNNGQVTPGVSPSSPQSPIGVRKTTRRTRANVKVEAVASFPALSTSESTESAASAASAAPAVPVKKARKPRRSNKKKPTPEEEAAKRETFLKRNREAAYKCRIKKKNQTEGIVERAKQLDADNAVKCLEVETLRSEIESLRAILLPHWRECGDAKLSEYVDGLVSSGWGLGKMVLRSVVPRLKFEVEDEPRMDDGRNDDLTHPRTEDDENGDAEMEGPANKRRRSSHVFEMSLGDFETSMDAGHQRRESYFKNSSAPEEVLKGTFGSARGASISTSGSETPSVRATVMGLRMDPLDDAFLIGDTPPPLGLSAPDGDFQ